jgi:glycosyltransferase involved in cell wall biosynthesis
MSRQKIRVVLLHNIVAPYKLPLFKFLALQKEIDFEVLFLSESAINRYWALKEKRLGFKYKVLPKVEFNFTGKDFLTYIINYTFPFEFLRKKFDVLVVHGWLDFATQIGFFLCKLTGRKYIVWSESSPYEESWRRDITKPLVKMLVRGADACIAIGTRSKEYFEILGVDPAKIFVAYYTMDLEHFSRGSQVGAEQKKILKDKLGIDDKKVILYVGQFIERKGVNYLLSAFKSLQKEVSGVSLLLVGYGPQKDFLLKRIKKEKIEDVFFHDYVEVSELPKMYAIADVFVLPSFEEAWGVVVNEAMAAGLPIITTRKVGASADLVFNSRNGFVVPERNSQALEKALKRLFSSPLLRSKMSRESRKIIKNFTPENTGKNFLRAIKYSMKK